MKEKLMAIINMATTHFGLTISESSKGSGFNISNPKLTDESSKPYLDFVSKCSELGFSVSIFPEIKVGEYDSYNKELCKVYMPANLWFGFKKSAVASPEDFVKRATAQIEARMGQSLQADELA